MQRHLVLTAVLALAAASPAAAQLRIPPVRLIAGIGEVDGGSTGVYVAPTGARYYTRHHPATALQLGLETTGPVRGVDLRLNLQHSNPQLTLGQLGTLEGPAPAPASDVYRTGVNTVTLDAAIHLPRVLDSSPYLLVGGGIRHYDFKQNYFEASHQPVVPRDYNQAVAHLGLGTAWNVGRYDLFVEGSTLLTRFRDPYTRNFDPIPQRSEWSFTAGLKIPLHR
ncbi:MAG TPA: hypothetical protein VFJ82_25545 [Longimicrobium sp.]|nr:hypothetical protein [Longimicrobium sp.]